jgi:small-conductance mechanosensitive channel
MNAQQSINLQIMEAFEKEKIEFAFPTRTVHLVKN